MLNKIEYIKRIIDEEIKEQLSSIGAVVIRGPKWCGKTTTSKQFSNSMISLQDPDNYERYKEIAENRVATLLEGDKPRLIDEWQEIPKIWNGVRYNIDETGENGQFILTGSSTPDEEKQKNLHSGVGRFAFIDMRTMSLFESGDSNGSISLKEILEGKRDIDGKTTNLTYEKISEVLCRGGWPNIVGKSLNVALKTPKNYIDTLVSSDISRIDNVSRNPELMRTILKSYARNVSTINSDQTIIADVQANYGDVHANTILSYLNVLEKLYIIEEIPAWNPNLRSKTTIRTAPKKTFVEPSLATAVLNISPKDLTLDPETFGLLFENLVNRDLQVYVKSIGGYLNHFRDRYGLECDNVVHFDNGKYALIEVKLGNKKIKEAEEHLLKIVDLIKIYNKENPKRKMDFPEFLMVITGNDMAYTTKEGVLVVPIGCLKN